MNSRTWYIIYEKPNPNFHEEKQHKNNVKRIASVTD